MPFMQPLKIMKERYVKNRNRLLSRQLFEYENHIVYRNVYNITFHLFILL